MKTTRILNLLRCLNLFNGMLIATAGIVGVVTVFTTLNFDIPSAFIG
jgi:hypothetical protein